jgi:hypothetical protein
MIFLSWYISPFFKNVQKKDQEKGPVPLSLQGKFSTCVVRISLLWWEGLGEGGNGILKQTRASDIILKPCFTPS